MSAQGLSPDVAKSSPEAEDSSPAGAASVRGTRESLWKRSKRTLGTTQFAFLQGKVATSGGEGENQSPSMLFCFLNFVSFGHFHKTNHIVILDP